MTAVIPEGNVSRAPTQVFDRVIGRTEADGDETDEVEPSSLTATVRERIRRRDDLEDATAQETESANGHRLRRVFLGALVVGVLVYVRNRRKRRNP